MKFSRGDALFTAAILVAIALLAGLLYLHSRERATGTGKVIGKVFYKREVAMRKFSDRMVWEDVENGSALYSHDAVMTGNLSDAELALDSGLKLRLEANTLVELDLEDSGLNLRLSGGGIKTAGVQTSPTLVTTGNGYTVNVTDGSAAIRTQGKQVAVEVKEGKVEVTTKEGKKETVSKNEILAAGKKSRTVLEILSPAEDATILAAGEAGRVKFKCSDAAKSAEVARTADFAAARAVSLTKGEAVMQAGVGDYLARCKGDDAISPVRRFRVVNAGGYKVFRPEKADIPFDDKPTLRLEFKPPQTVAQTLIEVADNAQFARPVFSDTRSDTALFIPLPKAGKYFFRLTPAAEGGRVESQIAPYSGSVNLAKSSTRAPLAFVSVNTPVFTTAQIESGKALIAVEGSAPYNLQIVKRGESKPVVNAENQKGPVKIPENLAPGKYEVRLASGQEKTALPFEVRDKIKVDLITPENNTVIYLTGEKTAALPLSWRGSDEVALYQLVLAEDAAFKNILKKINVEGKDFRFTNLTPRKYYVRVLALENGVPRAESAAHAVTIEEKLQQVEGLYPPPDKNVDITKAAGLNLKWKPVPGATSYEVKVFQKRKGALVLVDSRTTKNSSFTVSDFKKLKEGDVVWEVRAQQADPKGRVVQKSEPVRSHVNLSFGPTPPAPEIVPVVEE